MKILYIASIRLPTEKAHGIQIMKTCEAFSKIGVDICLSTPRFILLQSNSTNLYEYYGIKKIFKINRFWTVRLIYLGPVGFFLETLVFFLRLLFSYDFWTADYIFSRDEMLTSFANLFGKRTIWETHTGSYNFFAKLSLKKSIFVVSISQGLKDFYLSKGVSESKIVVSPDGVDIEDFQISNSKDEIRAILGLPKEKKIVLYAGRLDGWKGVETLFEASKSFKENAVLVVVGGRDDQISFFSKQYPKVLFLGHKQYIDLPMYQKSADVLVISNTAKDDISRLFTSPLKVFSYMASGVPIVAPLISSIEEVLNHSNSVLVIPDSPKALSDGINKVLDDGSVADIIAKQALIDVSKFSWIERAKKIVSRIS